tara:strand:+ start:2148 stop:3041 length:894 start_codon:yes stop_codon:yes gene_type:complete
MARDVRLNKEVFNKRIYQKTIDTTFKELGVKTIQEQIDEQPTVQEFFDMYTELFYQINERGPDNSHEYLVKTSGEYISFEDKDELVEALQKEIATLRKELLQAQQDLADVSQPLPEIEEVEVPIENPVVDIVNTPEPVQDTLPPPPPPPEDPPIVKYVNDFKKDNPGKGYKAFPVSRKMMIENFNYINDERKNDFPEDAGIYRLATGVFLKTYFAVLLETVHSSENSALKTYDINLDYKFARWDKLRSAVKNLFDVTPIPNDSKIRDNVYYIIEQTVEQMQKHYNKYKNFDEVGGFL